MPSIIRNASNGFWDQYPIGTKLDWTFLSHQLNKNRIAIFNMFMLFFSLFTTISQAWNVSRAELLSLTRDVIQQHMPSGSRGSKYMYLAMAYPIFYTLVLLGLCFALILLVLALVILPAFTMVILGIWALAVLSLFFFWLAFYRYPIFELLLPRIRRWILINNSHVYSQLPQDPFSIRLVRLKAGKAGDKIKCDIVVGPLSTLDFEALSYVWGVSILPYTIQIEGKPFYITTNLQNALKQLRHPDNDRLMWIDAICINQYDNAEKAVQVQSMRDIYARASKVIVWLGNATKATLPTFDFVRQFGAEDAEAAGALWRRRNTLKHWRRIRNEFENIFDHEWWTRAWIIQEIVVGRDVVVQRGQHQIEWEGFHNLLIYEDFLEDEFHNFLPPLFAQDVQKLRTEETASEAISNSLLSLAFHFRFQLATFGSDKIYALLGLLKSGTAPPIVPDYNKSPEEVFLEFTVSCLRENNDLSVIRVAAGTELQGVSWCRDWRFSHDGFFATLGLGIDMNHPSLTGSFSASGSQHPVFEADLDRRVLSLQGYEADTIEQIGNFHEQIRPKGIDWNVALRAWEFVAGEHLIDNSNSREAFNRTITTDRWPIEPLDWKKRIVARPRRPTNDEDIAFEKAVDDACINRRFFVTKHGRFGLGPWNLKKGDTVCVLLGGETPFILTKCNSKASMKGRVDETKGTRTHYRVVGEAYVHGLMHYEGSMEDDLKNHVVATQWFHLL